MPCTHKTSHDFFQRQTIVCELNFPSKVLAAKMNRKRLVVVLEEKISIYDLHTMTIVHTIETIPNPNGKFENIISAH